MYFVRQFFFKPKAMYKQLFSAASLIFFLSINAIAQQFPFPQHTQYHNHIKPSQYSQEELDQQVRDFYDGWKNKYLRQGCEDDQYHVYFASGNTVTVSEAMGYGMLIVPLMAGYDENAQSYFDGLYRYFRAHSSHIMPNLMAWKQITGCVNSDGPDSATDGDMDIAFGLLLAHAQWGSGGAINYFQEALSVINDIMGNNASEGDINQDFYSIKLGDWVSSGHFMNGTRTSDFIMDHFRAFNCAANDTNWNAVVDKCYGLIGEMQDNYSPETGLLPDFIEDLNTSARPADPNYLEGDLDGNYSYNACRDPWRMASDYLISGDERAKTAVLKINSWLLESTGGNANNIYAGYYLDGSKAVGWSDNSFTAPFAVGAMLDTENQEWLNKLYSKILSANIANGGYYDNTLKLLAMITISGNYWVPACDILNGTSELEKNRENNFRVFPSTTSGSLTLEINNDFSNQQLNLQVFNSSGKMVLSDSFQNTNPTQYNISHFPKGMYLVALVTSNGKPLGTQKVIKL
jgi:endo-1,4-beta-D-glucanase Y